MSSDSYKAALEAARNEIGQLARQREQLDQRIAQLTKIIESLMPLVESEAAIEADSKLVIIGEGGVGKSGVLAALAAATLIDPEAGITQAIKRVFEVFGTGPTGAGVAFLTPIDVRKGLTLAGWDLNQHTNHMATIHSVLKRLVEQGWLEQSDDGKSYQRTVLNSPSTFAEDMIERPWTANMRRILGTMNQQTTQANAQITENLSKTARDINEAVVRTLDDTLSLGPRPARPDTQDKPIPKYRPLGPRPKKES